MENEIEAIVKKKFFYSAFGIYLFWAFAEMKTKENAFLKLESICENLKLSIFNKNKNILCLSVFLILKKFFTVNIVKVWKIIYALFEIMRNTSEIRNVTN